MKKLILSVTCATALTASLAQAQMSSTTEESSTSTTTSEGAGRARERTSESTTTVSGGAARERTSESTTVSGGGTSSTTTSTTMSTGTVTDFVPGESIVLKTESASPVHYKFSKKVTYVNKAGKTIEATTIKKSSPVSVHYVKEGDSMIVDRVIVDQE